MQSTLKVPNASSPLQEGIDEQLTILPLSLREAESPAPQAPGRWQVPACRREFDVRSFQRGQVWALGARPLSRRWRLDFLEDEQIPNGSSVAMDEKKRLSEFLNLQVVLTISPYPESMREEFTVDTRCISDDYEVEFEPTVIGQYVRHGKVALTLLVRITPKKPR